MSASATEALTHALALELGATLHASGDRVVSAESCTGGGVARAITEVAGSSAWFERGFVTYTNAAKHELLGVSQDTLDAHGAVSEAVVREMCAGALAASPATLAVAVSGIAGPGGATPGKPVGLVCLAWQRRGEAPASVVRHYAGDRHAVREQAVAEALAGLRALGLRADPAVAGAEIQFAPR